MGIRLRSWGGIVVLTTLLSMGSNTALADEHDIDLAPLDAPTAPAVLDRNSGFNDYWGDDFTGGDAKFLFNIDPDGNRVHRDARRIEAFYNDYLQQLDEDNPTIRTQDLPNPYSTSVKELEDLK